VRRIPFLVKAELIPLRDAVNELRLAGFPVSPDRLQRFRSLGIQSKRLGRRYFIDAATLRDLTYILKVEKFYGLRRDHDALALELAYRGYPHVSWRRVYAAARKRPARLMKKLDRDLRRFGRLRGAATGEAMRKLAFRIARHYIPDHKLDEDLSYGFARELLESVIEALLNAAYLGQPFGEARFRRMFMGMGVCEADAVALSSQIAQFLNEHLFPMIQMNSANAIRQAMERPASASRVRDTITMMRKLQSLLPRIRRSIGGPGPDSVQDYPLFDRVHDPLAHIECGVHCVYFAVMFGLVRNKTAQSTMARYLAGKAPEIDQAIDSMKVPIEMIPAVIRKQY
jgi:hypothetical protein